MEDLYHLIENNGFNSECKLTVIIIESYFD